MSVERLPEATARRLPVYYRHLRALLALGRQRVSSAEVGDALRIDSATIRRDFSYLGELGKKGYGYSVPFLVQILQGVLGQDEYVRVVLIGVGNLGTALCRYNFYRHERMNIVAAFDVDPAKIGTHIDAVPIYGMDQLAAYVREEAVEIAILTVPASHAQDSAEAVVRAGIRGILNFAPHTLDLPPSVRVHQIDMSTELQVLVYHLRANARLADGAP